MTQKEVLRHKRPRMYTTTRPRKKREPKEKGAESMKLERVRSPMGTRMWVDPKDRLWLMSEAFDLSQGKGESFAEGYVYRMDWQWVSENGARAPVFFSCFVPDRPPIPLKKDGIDQVFMDTRASMALTLMHITGIVWRAPNR